MSNPSNEVSKREKVRRPGEPPVTRLDSSEMIAATARARATLDQFIVRIQAKPDPNHRGFAIKAAFASPDGECEHIWITSPTWDGQQFTGQIDNEPLATKLVKLGDVVHVKPDELTDWMYLDSNQLVGGYTVRLLYPTVRAKKDD